MATSEHTTGTRDEHYNMISVLYHALQGADTCATYLQDAERTGDQNLVQSSVRSRACTGSWPSGARHSCGNGSGKGVGHSIPRSEG
jgi:hypothetical protein